MVTIFEVNTRGNLEQGYLMELGLKKVLLERGHSG